MIYKYTKCESVIAKVMADANMSEKDIRITDMREWIFEAIEKIGAPMQYVHKESGVDSPILKIHNFQVPIPDDLHNLNTVAYSTSPDGPWQACRTTNAQLHSGIDTITNPEQITYHKPTTVADVVYDDAHRLSKRTYKSTDDDVVYRIKPGWIVLNRNEGFVKLGYKAVATDERGYPLVPDSESYQEAIYWYVMMKLNFPRFLEGSLSDRHGQNIYLYLQQQWAFYRGKAYAEAMMPTEDDMKSIKNENDKLIQDWESDDTFFKNVGKRQLNYNDYFYGY